MLLELLGGVLTLHLFQIVCVWTGINAINGLYTALCVLSAKQKVPPFEIEGMLVVYVWIIAVILGSIALLSIMVVGSAGGVAMLIEMLLVYNTFFTLTIIPLLYELHRFLKNHPDNELNDDTK